MALGFNKVDTATALGSIIGRMVSPGSELQTHDWLQNRTGLGELLDHDYGNTSLTRLYTVSDKLLKHQTALESFLADREQALFNLNRKIVLYDLTNTYFEGQCAPDTQKRNSVALKRNARIAHWLPWDWFWMVTAFH